MPMVMPDWLAQRALLSPRAVALHYGDSVFTFGDLHAEAGRLAGSLAAAGVQAGDHVAFWLGNSPEFVIAVHACARLRAVIVPLNLRLSPAEVSFQLVRARVKWLLHGDDEAETACGLATEAGVTALCIDELRHDGLAAPVPADRVDLATVQAIVFTSGTTGRPKGAMLTFGNHWWSAVGSMLNLGLHAEDKWLAVLPLFHVGGLSIVWRSVIYGIPVVLHPRFDVDDVHRAIEADGVSIVSAVGSMLTRLLDCRGSRRYPDTLRCVLVGGGPVPKTLLERARDVGMPVVQTYGLTETASQVVTLPPQDAVRKLGSAGKPLFPVQLRIEQNGRSMAPMEPGEIVVHGPTVMHGYFDDPHSTSSVLRKGWLHTGDVGYVDDEGYLFVLDRRDDMFISGGENVYPAEIESVLQTHPDVVEAGVVGVRDSEWGRVPVAFVVPREKADVRTLGSDLQQHCREKLAGYKVPRRVSFVDGLPRNAAGKLLRRLLAEEAGAG